MIVRRGSGGSAHVQELTTLKDTSKRLDGDREQVLTQTAPSEKEEGLIPIRAPLLGTFYRSPKPGASPFVEMGQIVSEEDTVCIIEVMKLFSTVKAGVKGRIVKICAEDGSMIEYKQTIFLV